MRGHRIEASGIERMAAGDASGGQPQPAQQPVHFQGLDRVLRTARVVTAVRSQQRAQEPLVYAYQRLNYFCAHASLICFHNCCKAPRSTGAVAERAEWRAPITISTGGSNRCCSRKLSRISRLKRLRLTALPTVRAAIDRPRRAPDPSFGRTVAVSSSFPNRRPAA